MFLKWKMPHFLLQSLTAFLVLVLCNVHIAWSRLSCHGKVTVDISRNFSDECNNCTKLQFYKENVVRDTVFIFCPFALCPVWNNQNCSLYHFKLVITFWSTVVKNSDAFHKLTFGPEKCKSEQARGDLFIFYFFYENDYLALKEVLI